jgi:DNA polymerase-3 subunit delta'
MALADVVGQERAVSRLRRAWAAGRLAQAYSFVGPEGVGKRTTALALAQAVNCQRPVAGETPDACGACPACRKIAAGNHPDVTLVTPAEKTVIDIDQIREVAGRATRRPYEGATKVWILDPADRMQEPAANAFLKTLEEPPGSALFVLVTTTPSALLPTIRSRCQEVRFELLGTEALETILGRHGLPAEKLPELARRAGGSAARALDSELEDEQAEQTETFQEILESLASVPATLARAEAIDRVLKEQERAHAQAFIEALILFFRDVAVVRMGMGAVPPLNPGWTEVASKWAKAATPTSILAIEEALRHARWALQPERNANRRLTLERLLLRMREAMRITEEVAHAPRGAR